jgi:hypothetical protein
MCAGGGQGGLQQPAELHSRHLRQIRPATAWRDRQEGQSFTSSSPGLYIPVLQILSSTCHPPKSDNATKSPFMYSFSGNLGGLSPNFRIHVSVSDLYSPRIGPHIWLQQNRQTNPENIKISHRYRNIVL